MNRLNIFLEHLYDGAEQSAGTMSLKDMLLYAKDIGISGLECDYNRLRDDRPGTQKCYEVKGLFDDCGLKVRSIYRTFDFCHLEDTISIKQIEDTVQTAHFYGADNILAIPGFIEDNDDPDLAKEKMVHYLTILVNKAAEYDIRVSLEDFDDKKAPYSTIEGLLFFMEKVPGLSFTFDTGNFAYSAEDELCAYDKLKRYITHVHFKDRSDDKTRSSAGNTNGCEDNEEGCADNAECRADNTVSRADNSKADINGKLMYPCEVGGGYIKIAECIKRLQADGYQGTYSIEHFGALNQSEYMKKSVDYLKKKIYISMC